MMDPSLAAPLATLSGAIATAILMYASYNWPAGRRRKGSESKKEDDDQSTDD